MEIKIKNIKTAIIVVAFLMLFSVSYLVFASINEATSKNFLLDSDQDGLTDEEEKTYGTDPYKADSDKDGYSDGVEVRNGYDPLKPAPGDKLVNENRYVTAAGKVDSLTEKLSEGLKPLLEATDSSENKTLSVDAVDEALNSSLGENMQNEVSFDSMPGFAVPAEKVIKQDYAALAETEKQKKLKEDTTKYLELVGYIIANNLPEDVAAPEDFKPFVDSLAEHLNDLGKTPPDYTYYRTLKSHVQIIVEEMGAVNVPENMLGVHVGTVRILKEYLAIGESAPTGSGDPIAQVVFLNKVRTLNDFTATFLQEAYLKIIEDMAGFKNQ